MNRFGILQRAFPARGSKRAASSTYVPKAAWRMFHSAGRKHGLQVLFFRTEDVDFRKRRVYAWSSKSDNGKSGWNRSLHPLPNVIYENYPVGVNISREKIIRVKRKLIRLGIPVFNPKFFNKASLQTILSRNPATSAYLPDGKVAAKVSDVSGLLKAHGVVYFKPVNGFQGRGIIEIKLLPNGRVRMKSDKFIGHQSLLKTCSMPKFKSFVGSLMKKKRYVVQQGLDLLQRDGRKIDFRVVVHRGADGNWYSAGIRPKLGRVGAMVTNSHAGGSKTTWEELERWAGQSGTPLPQAAELENPAIAAAELLTKYRPTLSHLGIDIAVDGNNRIYLLDFNVVPGRDLLTRGMLRRVTDLTAGFAGYLAANRKAKNIRK